MTDSTEGGRTGSWFVAKEKACRLERHVDTGVRKFSHLLYKSAMEQVDFVMEVKGPLYT